MDPPWQYDNKRTGGSLKSGSQQHYETMNFQGLWRLWPESGLANLMNDNSMIFMWSTNSMLETAFQLFRLYGYEFKTMITWVKKNYGLGYWFRGKTEHILFGIRGKVPALKMNLPNLIISEKVTRHSEKPPEFYQLVNDIGTKYQSMIDREINILELFGRKKSTSALRWVVLGNEISGNDIKGDLSRLILEH
jgi:N6-adenosine-specific RNA methylase IME4